MLDEEASDSHAVKNRPDPDAIASGTTPIVLPRGVKRRDAHLAEFLMI